MEIDVRMPRPYEIVGTLLSQLEITAAAMFYGAGGNAATFRVLDGAGNVLTSRAVAAAGSGEFGGPIAVVMTLPSVPSSIDGTLEIHLGHQITGLPTVSLPIQFGRAIMNGYISFSEHTVTAGESLWSIAELEYSYGTGGGALWNYVYSANRHQIADPNLIHVGQVLLVPHGTETQQ